jgi:hypothetical protein
VLSPCALSRISRFIGTAGLLLLAANVRADDVYFHVPVDHLKITSGELPKAPVDRPTSYFAFSPTAEFVIPYAVLDRDGEIYVTGADQPTSAERASVDALCIRSATATDLTGTLYVPNASRSGLQKIKFVVPASAADPKQRTAFYQAKEKHYRRLIDRQLPGGSWFRYQERTAQAALAGKSAAEFEAQTRQRPNIAATESQLDDTFELFSGGRAVSENLQLDRLLPPGAPELPTIDLASLAGITVAEMDWRPLTKDILPQTDPLPAMIPSDQHALLFPSFNAMLRTMDEAERDGTPVLQLIQSRAEDARTRERYQKQLCLTVDALSRLLGDQVVASVAFTGSDPYLPSGSDVAILFESKNAEAVRTHIATRQAAAVQANPRCKKIEGSLGNVKYTGALSPDRAICSYLAPIGRAVVVTNSLAQLKRIVDTSAGRSESLGSLPEYRFFRKRYPLGKNETGLLIVTDKTIRRWCSPRWRIASSRRTRAMAVLSHYQAEFLKELESGTVEPHDIHTVLQVADLGTLRVTKEGVTSSTYGTLEFQTPIAELDFTKVTKTEADTYERWRQGYQRNWSQFFDPIAVGFSIRDDRLVADLTVMPLIESSNYREFIEIASGAELKSTAGDPHADSLLHWALAINTKSERLKWASNFLEGPVKVSLLGWLGESISVYADSDPFWAELAAAMKARDSATSGDSRLESFFEANLYRLPVAITAEVKDSLKLTLFLSGVRAFIEQTAPGLLSWTALEYHGQPYVKIAATENGRSAVPFAAKLAIHYAATPRRLIVTLNEDVLKRAIDRQAAAKNAKNKQEVHSAAKPASDAPRPWLGKSMALQIDRQALDLLESVFGRHEYQALMQARAWSNITILNEWKRLYPDRDPVVLHQKFWQAALVCPGGGKYVWNNTYQTMESTVYGHPGEPKTGPTLPQPLKNVRWLDFGLTFENHGLRAKAEIRRTGSK